MKFAVLEKYKQKNTDLKPTESEEITSETPTKKISYERIVGVIDNMGHNLANDKKTNMKDKIKYWVDILKWALPLIPDEHQHMKAQIKSSIQNPSESDFMPRPKRKKAVSLSNLSRPVS